MKLFVAKQNRYFLSRLANQKLIFLTRYASIGEIGLWLQQSIAKNLQLLFWGCYRLSNRTTSLADEKSQRGFVLPTMIAFMVVIGSLSLAVSLISLQAFQNSKRQQHIQQAQLASVSAMEFAKEQYEIDINFMGTPETDFITTSNYRVTYEVQHIAYTNALNTQQKVRAIGRVYTGTNVVPIAQREIIGILTRMAGSDAAVRFIFIIDNSGSMSVSEWNDSKTTVDIAIQHILSNIPNAEVAVVQYGTNHFSHEHKYDVTVPFTNDPVTAVNWDRRYGHGTAAFWDLQDHLAASLARMRTENVYGAGSPLDLTGATNIQFVLFTDAFGMDHSGCCTALKHFTGSTFDTTNNGAFTTLDQHGEFNALKDGSVFSAHGHPGLSAQFTVLNINQSSFGETIRTSAAIASPGGSWTGVVDENPGDPEGEGIIPRRFINTSLLQTDPSNIIDIINEIIQAELHI